MDSPIESEVKDKTMIRFASEGIGIPDFTFTDEEEDEVSDDSDQNTSNRPVSTRDINENSEQLWEQGPERRKSSYLASGLGRPSSMGMVKRGKLSYEPTYRMEPKPGGYFIWFKVRNLIAKLATSVLEGFHYDERTAPTTCKLMCNKILMQAKKKFDCPRYRYVCQVTMAQLKNQGIIIADRSLWMLAMDNYSPYVYRTKEFVCVVTFHALYQE